MGFGFSFGFGSVQAGDLGLGWNRKVGSLRNLEVSAGAVKGFLVAIDKEFVDAAFVGKTGEKNRKGLYGEK